MSTDPKLKGNSIGYTVAMVTLYNEPMVIIFMISNRCFFDTSVFYKKEHRGSIDSSDEKLLKTIPVRKICKKSGIALLKIRHYRYQTLWDIAVWNQTLQYCYLFVRSFYFRLCFKLDTVKSKFKRSLQALHTIR